MASPLRPRASKTFPRCRPWPPPSARKAIATRTSAKSSEATRSAFCGKLLGSSRVPGPGQPPGHFGVNLNRGAQLPNLLFQHFPFLLEVCDPGSLTHIYTVNLCARHGDKDAAKVL